MAIDGIKNTITSIPTNAKNLADTVGEAAINNAGKARDFIKEKINIKSSPSVDTFVKSVKDRTPDVIKKNKKTIVGAAVILAAVASLAAVVKSIVGKIKEAKQTSVGYLELERPMHQG